MRNSGLISYVLTIASIQMLIILQEDGDQIPQQTQIVPPSVLLADLPNDASDDSAAASDSSDDDGASTVEDHEEHNEPLDQPNPDTQSNHTDSQPQSSQPPPTTPPESMYQPIAREPPSSLLLALSLLFKKSGGSRQDYVRTREVLQLSHSLINPDVPLELPAKLDTVKRIVRANLPMLRLLRKVIPVTIEKQPSLPAQQKTKRRIMIHRQS